MATGVVFALSGPILLKYFVIISSLDDAIGGTLNPTTIRAVPLQVNYSGSLRLRYFYFLNKLKNLT